MCKANEIHDPLILLEMLAIRKQDPAIPVIAEETKIDSTEIKLNPF
jgi:hypothetical protein